MRKITLGFSRPKNRAFPIASWLIRWYLNTPYSHVYIQFDCPWIERTVIYESVGHGLRFISKEEWEKKAEVTNSFDVNVPSPVFLDIVKFCIDNSGKDYAFMQNVGYVVAGLFKLTHNPFNSNQNCSEITAKVINIIKKIFNEDLNLVTPKDIFRVLNENKVPGQKLT